MAALAAVVTKRVADEIGVEAKRPPFLLLHVMKNTAWLVGWVDSVADWTRGMADDKVR